MTQNNKWYHRGNGEVVVPEINEPIRKEFGNQSHDPFTCLCYACHDWTVSVTEWEQYLASLPPLPNVKCSSDAPIGWLEGYEERYEIMWTPQSYEWKPATKEHYDLCSNPANRRIFLTPPADLQEPVKNVEEITFTANEVEFLCGHIFWAAREWKDGYHSYDERFKHKTFPGVKPFIDNPVVRDSINKLPASWQQSLNVSDELQAERERSKGLVEALEAIVKEPYGCRFCHSGKLITPDKDHDNNCGYLMAIKVLSKPNS